MHNLRDFRPDLRTAVVHLHRAGFDGEAYVIAAALEGAYGSALEMVQAIGGAVMRVQRSLGDDLPREVRTFFHQALADVASAVAALTPLGGACRRGTPGAPAPATPCSSS